MKAQIIEMLNKRVCTLDRNATKEISNIIDYLSECEPCDIAVNISECDIFSTLDEDAISVMVEEKIIELRTL